MTKVSLNDVLSHWVVKALALALVGFLTWYAQGLAADVKSQQEQLAATREKQAAIVANTEAAKEDMAEIKVQNQQMMQLLLRLLQERNQ